MRVGLVLGGGGGFGVAYHAGALAAIAHDCRWDPRDADVIVGTSAGAIVASLLRAGVPADDLAATLVGVELSGTPHELVSALDDRPDPPRLTLRQLLRLPRRPSIGLVARAVTMPWTLHPTEALVSVLPDGAIDMAETAPVLHSLPTQWPDRALWLVAHRHGDLRRVVFGRRGEPAATVSQAIAASCAVPGYFAPVRIGTDLHVDGGVISSTNADVLAGHDLDLIIVVAPLGCRGTPPLTQRLWRRLVSHRVRREERALRSTAPVVVIEPGSAVTRHFGTALMRPNQIDALTRASWFDVARQTEATGLRTMLGSL
jgi:NTE family protein